ncbi:MAG: DUF2382 domain-containing protein [Acidobacteria bacterium]|nr:DUF2382 domain-containing protein [Acidobacteriota bacterium]
MSELQHYRVRTSSGRSGKVFRASRFLDQSEFNRVLLDDGSDLTVPSKALRVQDDGSFLMTEAPPEPAPPPIVFDEPLFIEDVQVERVPVNRIIDTPAETRQEGDVTIVPVMEEVVMIERRLLLKEEVRITRHRAEITRPRSVVLDPGESRLLGADGRLIDTGEAR